MTFRPIEDDEAEAVAALWAEVGLSRPWNPPLEDIAEFRAHPTAEVLVATDASGVRATVAVCYDGHRGWVYYVATRPDLRGQGLGRATMEAAEAWLRERGVKKLQLMVRTGNEPVLDFYRAQGFEDGHTTLMQKWLDPARDRLYREAQS